LLFYLATWIKDGDYPVKMLQLLSLGADVDYLGCLTISPIELNGVNDIWYLLGSPWLRTSTLLILH
jgi:hypothetical protein